MTADNSLGSALVRFRATNGHIVGAGFLIAPGHVVTCAHVAAAVLGVEPRTEIAPAGELAAEFPLLPSGAQVRAEIIEWLPLRADETGDVAVLRLLEDAPEGAAAVPIVPESEVWGHRFRVCGFPRGHDGGRWVGGELRARQGNGWIQLEADVGRAEVERGFSGAPVWDEDTGAVAGMMVTKADRGTAFLMPPSSLGDSWSAHLPEPYRGLDAFREEDAEFFHGRDAEVERLRRHLEARSLLLVAGPSGSGKSSLVRAGLLTRLRTAGVTISELQRKPGVGARATFADLLAGLRAEPGTNQRATERDRIRNRLAGGTESIALLAGDLLAATGPAGALLFVDQFEEVVLDDPDTARELLRLTIELLDAQPGARRPHLRAVLTLRSGSLDELVTSTSAARLASAVALVGPMDTESLRAAITAPVAKVGSVAFEADLVDRILRDAGDEPGRLPLVEFALTELWRGRTGRMLTHQAYDRIGGVSGALAGYAEDELWHRLTPEQREKAPRLFTALARPSGDDRFGRRRVPLANLRVDLHPLAHLLAATRLLVVSEGGEIVELAHQALVDEWPRLRGWLSDDQEFLAWHEQLRVRREQWESSGRDPKSLLGGVALANAMKWRDQRGMDLSAPERDFIARGRGRQRREVWSWRAITAIALVAAALAGLLAVRVNDQLHDATATLLAQESKRNALSEAATALQFAQAAWREQPGNRDAYGALLSSYVKWQFTGYVSGPTGTIAPGTPPVASADGGIVVTFDGALTGRAVVWLWRDTKLEGWVPTPDAMSSAALSADGRLLALGDPYGAVSLWNIADRSRLVLLRPADRAGGVNVLRFSADNQFLVVITGVVVGQTQLEVWQVSHPPRLVSAIRDLPTDLAPSAAMITRDGAIAATGELIAGSSGVVVWNLANGSVRQRYSRAIIAGDAIVSCESDMLHARDPSTGDDHGRRQPWPCTTQGFSTDATGQFIQLGLSPTTLWGWRNGQTYHVPGSRSATAVASIDASGELTVRDWLDGAVATSRGVRTSSPPSLSPHPPQPLFFDPDGQFWIDNLDNRLVRVNAATGAATRGTAPTCDSGSVVKLTPRGGRLLEAACGSLRIYRGADFSLEQTISIPAPPIPGSDEVQHATVIPLSDDEAALGYRGVVTRYSLVTGRPLDAPLPLSDDQGERDRLAVSHAVHPRPDHPNQVVANLGQTAAIWDLVQRRRLDTVPIKNSGEDDFAIDPGGRYLAISSSDRSQIQVWDLETAELLVPIPGSATMPPAFSGDILAFINTTNSHLQLWRWRSAELLAELTLGQDRFWSLGNNRISYFDGRVPALNGEFRPATTLPLDPEVWFSWLCKISDRRFTDEELAGLPSGASRERPCVRGR